MKNIKLAALISLFVSLFLINNLAISESAGDESIPAAEHYEGGKEQLLKDIQAELNYPPAAKRNRVQGTCIIHVKLMEDGSMQNISAVKNIGGGCGEEGIRIIKTLTFKAPGYSADYNIPVKFKL